MSQSGAVVTKSGPPGPFEDLRGPQKGHLGPKWALLGPPGAQYQVKVCGEHESNRQTNRGQSGPNLGPGFKACSKSAGSNSQHSFHMI